MKCSFGISDFLEEIPSLSHSVVFLYFFALITEEGFLISSCYSAYLRLLIFLPEILISACASSSLAFRMMYSPYKLNKQGDNIQPWCTLFSILNQSVIPYLVLAVSTLPACRFLKRQVRWSHFHLFKNFPQFVVIHIVKVFGIVNKAKVDVFLELSCFFHNPADVGNLISGSSAFSKTSSNIWKFMVHVLLKPGLGEFWALLY